MIPNLEKQVKNNIDVSDEVRPTLMSDAVEKIVGEKGKGHPLPNKTSYVVTR